MYKWKDCVPPTEGLLRSEQPSVNCTVRKPVMKTHIIISYYYNKLVNKIVLFIDETEICLIINFITNYHASTPFSNQPTYR